MPGPDTTRSTDTRECFANRKPQQLELEFVARREVDVAPSLAIHLLAPAGRARESLPPAPCRPVRIADGPSRVARPRSAAASKSSGLSSPTPQRHRVEIVDQRHGRRHRPGGAAVSSMTQGKFDGFANAVLHGPATPKSRRAQAVSAAVAADALACKESRMIGEPALSTSAHVASVRPPALIAGSEDRAR